MNKNRLQFTANCEQRRALEGLAYWIADYSYIKERYGYDDPELEMVHKTITQAFDELDKIEVPFWVQNHVICWAHDWRNTKSQYLSNAMKRYNIIL